MSKNIQDLPDKPYAFSETGALQGPYPSPMEPNVFCVKTPNFKLIFLKTPNKWQLYDLKNDPFEKNNIFDDNLKITEELKTQLTAWMKR